MKWNESKQMLMIMAVHFRFQYCFFFLFFLLLFLLLLLLFIVHMSDIFILLFCFLGGFSFICCVWLCICCLRRSFIFDVCTYVRVYIYKRHAHTKYVYSLSGWWRSMLKATAGLCMISQSLFYVFFLIFIFLCIWEFFLT